MTRLRFALAALVVGCTPSESPPPTAETPRGPTTTVTPPEVPPASAAASAAPNAAPAPPSVARPAEPRLQEATAAAIEPPPSTPTLIYEEQLGGLRLGMTIAELQAARPTLVRDGDVVPIPPEGGPNYAIAAYGQELVDDAAALRVELESLTKDGEFRATAIWAEIDATAVTGRGVGIGATRKAVKKAYPRARPLVEDELYARISDHEEVWFGFEQGKVMRIGVGSATDPDDIEE